MGKKSKIAVFAFIAIDVLLVLWLLLHDATFPVLHPNGAIAIQERNLFVFAIVLALSIILPVFIMTAIIVMRYRKGNTKASYTPNWNRNRKLEVLWWIIPSTIIFILAVVTWYTTHALDPYKPLASNTKPMTIQVVALQWKWLFIYPEQNIATVNYVVFPEKTPLTFELTADAPMNSLWIPHLGGQLYAMAGMVTKHHLMANETGEFPGSSAEISGEGFASMRFTAKATTSEEFEQWVESVKSTATPPLDQATYDTLAKPNTHPSPTFYASVEKDMYNKIVMKYKPSNNMPQNHKMNNDTSMPSSPEMH